MTMAGGVAGKVTGDGAVVRRGGQRILSRECTEDHRSDKRPNGQAAAILIHLVREFFGFLLVHRNTFWKLVTLIRYE